MRYSIGCNQSLIKQCITSEFDKALPVKFKESVKCCKLKLQKYYKKTSLLSMAACILDPRFKTDLLLNDYHNTDINDQIEK